MGHVVGTCSRCSGPVMIPDPWWGVVPPRPTCASCGAVAAQPYGPVIPMKPREAPIVDALGRRVGTYRGPRYAIAPGDAQVDSGDRLVEYDSRSSPWPAICGDATWISGGLT